MVGCPILKARIAKGELRPRLHIFGHIHESHGAHIHSWESDGACDGPEVQNDITYPIELAENMSSGKVKEVEMFKAMTVRSLEEAEQRNMDRELKRTVFVNAACFPSGRNAWRDGVKVREGGYGFRPVVVDLKDWPESYQSNQGAGKDV